jgi:hypothetical protein
VCVCVIFFTSQAQLKMALNELANTVKEPYKMMKDAFAQILPVIKRNAEKIKTTLMDMKSHLSNIGKCLKKIKIICKLCAIFFSQFATFEMHSPGSQISQICATQKNLLLMNIV